MFAFYKNGCVLKESCTQEFVILLCLNTLTEKQEVINYFNDKPFTLYRK